MYTLRQKKIPYHLIRKKTRMYHEYEKLFYELYFFMFFLSIRLISTWKTFRSIIKSNNSLMLVQAIIYLENINLKQIWYFHLLHCEIVIHYFKHISRHTFLILLVHCGKCNNKNIEHATLHSDISFMNFKHEKKIIYYTNVHDVAFSTKRQNSFNLLYHKRAGQFLENLT